MQMISGSTFAWAVIDALFQFSLIVFYSYMMKLFQQKSNLERFLKIEYTLVGVKLLTNLIGVFLLYSHKQTYISNYENGVIYTVNEESGSHYDYSGDIE